MDRNQTNEMLFLTDEQLLQGIELMFFAYKGFTSDPDRILEEYGYGRAHHRAIHFINRSDAITVNGLLTILGVTKQSLNRVLRQLIDDDMVESRVGVADKRQRHLHLTDAGQELEKKLSSVQRERVREAYKAAGSNAVQGFRKVLENMVDADMKPHIEQLGMER
ncbi:MAG: MarR family transcriptional regulator [Pseudomonadota bacterium]